jgi:hypothetical protein
MDLGQFRLGRCFILHLCLQSPSPLGGALGILEALSPITTTIYEFQDGLLAQALLFCKATIVDAVIQTAEKR